MGKAEKLESIYPEVIGGGGLLAVMRSLFQNGVNGVEVNGFDTGRSYAHVRLGHKGAQVFLCLEERLFMFDFWEGEEKLAAGSSPNLSDVTESIANWLLKETDVAALSQRFLFVHKNLSGC